MGSISTVDNANGCVRFERDPESMFIRVFIQDDCGNLFKTIIMEN